MRAAARKFLSDPRPDFRNITHRHGRWDDRETDAGFFVALGELRATFGLHIATLACLYGIDVEEGLAAIMPPDNEDRAAAPGEA